MCTYKRYAEASRERAGQMVHGQWDGRIVPLESGSGSREAEVRKLKSGSWSREVRLGITYLPPLLNLRYSRGVICCSS